MSRVPRADATLAHVLARRLLSCRARSKTCHVVPPRYSAAGAAIMNRSLVFTLPISIVMLACAGDAASVPGPESGAMQAPKPSAPSAMATAGAAAPGSTAGDKKPGGPAKPGGGGGSQNPIAPAAPAASEQALSSKPR